MNYLCKQNQVKTAEFGLMIITFNSENFSILRSGQICEKYTKKKIK